MLNVKFRNNVTVHEDIVDESTTVRSIMEEYGVDSTRNSVMVNGSTLNRSQLDMTLADLKAAGYGITDSVSLIAVTKTDNA